MLVGRTMADSWDRLIVLSGSHLHLTIILITTTIIKNAQCHLMNFLSFMLIKQNNLMQHIQLKSNEVRYSTGVLMLAIGRRLSFPP